MASVSVPAFVADAGRRAALWLAVALGFTIPISTALDNLLVATFVLCWIISARYLEKQDAVRANGVAIAAIAFFLLQVTGTLYSQGSHGEILRALDKASVILLVPMLISLRPGTEVRERALLALMAAILLTLILSSLLWLELLPQSSFVKGYPSDPEVFRKRITQSVLTAFGAFYFALRALETGDFRRRALFACVAAAALFNVLFMVHSRTGQVVLLALLLYALLARFRGRGALAAFAVVVVLAGTIYLVPSSAVHQRVATTVQEIKSWRAGEPATAANMRLEAWSNSLEILHAHPIAGVGTGGFAAAYAREVEGTSMAPLRQPENQYLLTSVQLGIIGLAGMIALFIWQWRSAARLATRMDTDLARGLVLTMAVGCAFNSFLLDHTEALFYAWLSGLTFSSYGRAGGRSCC